MKRFLDAADGFFFARRAAWPFGLMRIAWAGVALAFLLMQWPDVVAYYSDAGFLPRDMVGMVTRETWVFSVLFWSGGPWFAWTVYLAALAALACSMLGIFPRVSTVIGCLLLASLHERQPMALGGGDTVLRHLGFLLMLAPGIRALSLPRLRLQYRRWRKDRSLLPPVTMPAWPYRLLLWQLIVIYASSAWWKSLGTMWIDGTAVGAALHHPIFTRWPYDAVNLLMPLAPVLTWKTVAWEAAWLLLLLPSPLLPRVLRTGGLKRLILAAGVLFHGSIAILMDVGSFSFAILAGYLGLLDDRDRAWLKRALDRRMKHPLVVLYDGSCRLCRRSAFVLALLDAFGHVRLVDFRNAKDRRAAAPHIDESQLDLAMHVLLPDRSVRTGFDGFRVISWHLPLLWISVPLLYIPGISHLGRRIYGWIAQNRQKCTHERC